MRTNIFIYALTVLLCFQSCNIDEDILDEALGSNLLESASDESFLAPVYNTLRDVYGHRALFSLQVYTSDEGMLPTRQNDWFDGGQFQTLHRHDWAPTHAYTTDTWDHLTSGLGSATQAIDLLEDGSQVEAEAIGLLSFYMMHTLDLFGQVPYRGLRDTNFLDDAQILSGSEAVDIIIENLAIAMPNLSSDRNSVRFTQDAATAMLARLYLNRAVYNDRYAANFTFDNADMQQVIDLTTQLISSGRYALETDNYFSLFDPDNDNHQEIVFAIKYEVTSPSIGGNSVTRNSTNGMSRGYFLTPSRSIRGSDAGCTLPGFLDTWDIDNDPRFFKENYAREVSFIPLGDYQINRGFLMGQQFGAKIVDGEFSFDENGLLAIDTLRSTRDESLANHTPEVNLIAINQSTGVRVIKWGIDPENDNRNDSGVDIAIFRLADLYLMRAEAGLRAGSGDALADINALREARGGTGFILNSVDLTEVYNERGFEFYWEYHRRTDQIRFGTWEGSWKDKTDTDVNHRLFPIPPASLAVTEGLEQNPGY